MVICVLKNRNTSMTKRMIRLTCTETSMATKYHDLTHLSFLGGFTLVTRKNKNDKILVDSAIMICYY